MTMSLTDVRALADAIRAEIAKQGEEIGDLSEVE